MKQICLTMLFALMCAGAYAQNAANLPDSAQTQQEKLRGFVQGVETFARLYPQEKAYLHLDNTGYFIGDTIWYKAYVVRPDTMAFTNLSGVLYVELVDPFGEILVTQKLKIEDGQCHGDIALSEVLTSGFYEIRAYTRYMTNWPAENIFSRVVPVFAKPKREGDYSHMEIEQSFVKQRTGNDMPDSLSRRQLRRWMKEKPPIVNFYPEGGHLVLGLMSTVAFEVSLPDSVNIDVEGELQTEQGEVLASVHTLREGRGTFVCTPYGEPLYLCFTHGGKDYRYPLPQAEREGCVMTVGALAPHHVPVQVNCSEGLTGNTLGQVLIHNGRILAFETHTFGEYDTWNVSYPRKELPTGIHQLTVFDSDGRILAQRHFFIYGDAAKHVNAEFADSTIAPCQKMALRLTGSAKQAVSLSVRDAETQTNGFNGNAATYLLLSSDLKGFVRDAEYYLEADDNAHRQAADLLCLVQGWARYDWQMMRAGEDFRWTQPIEDGLYLDGMLHPRLNYWGSTRMSRKARRATHDIGGVRLSAIMYSDTGESMKGETITDSLGRYVFNLPELKGLMYSDTGESMKGETITDSLGRYVFNLPELKGRWYTQLHTTKDGEERKHIISINRLFQPEMRELDYYECGLREAGEAPFQFQYTEQDYAVNDNEQEGLWYGGETHELGEAVVKSKKNRHYLLKSNFISRSHFHFDMQREADRYADNGEDMPKLEEWILSKPLFADLFYNKHRAIGYVGWGSWYGIGPSKALFTIEGYPEKEYYTTGGYMAGEDPVIKKVLRGAPHYICVKYGGDRCGKTSNHNYIQSVQGWKLGPEICIGDIEDIFDLYISTQDNVTEYMFDYEVSFLRHYNPFHVYVDGYKGSGFYGSEKRNKSWRRTIFQGYNVPHTFHMPDYSQMPPEADFRRTLYWNPDVLLDDNGEAIVEFYNNSTCRRISVSAEGVTADGKPIQTSTAYHPRHVAAGAAH